MAHLHLTVRSLWNRRATALLTVAAIAISVALLLGVQKLRTAARDSFASTLSGTDLIVGARTGPLNLLLYSVFRVGDATTNVSWASYRKIAGHSDVAWTIPLALGDSHRGFRVLGTSGDYFQHYRFAGGHPLEFSSGTVFDGLYDAVLGAEVAESLGYGLGSTLVIAHGLGAVSFAPHDDRPFRVVGILQRTGTPVDRTIHVSLASITAVHRGSPSSAPSADGARPDVQGVPGADLTPEDITAFLVGMKSPVVTLTMQRAINDYRQEALLAIIPGVALTQLWELVGIADGALALVAACAVLAGLLGMVTAILTSLQERRREMAILRSVGAGPLQIFGLLITEAGVLAMAGVMAGAALAFALLGAAQPLIARRFGIHLLLGRLGMADVMILAAIVVAALLVGMLPAWRAYRNALADGLTMHI